MRARLTLLSVCVFVCESTAQPTPLDLALASEDAAVLTTGGRTFRGRLDGVRDGRLHIRSATGGGEVGYSFARGEIEKLSLPGTETEAQALELMDRSLASDARPLLEALFRQRVRYLPFLNAAQTRPLVALVDAAAGGDPIAVVGYVNALLAHITTPMERQRLLDARLAAHAHIGLREETRRLAHAWCVEAGAEPGSALGWSVLARLAYDEGDYTRARWVALQPVTFSTYLPMPHLDTCYAIAIAASRRLGAAAEADRLDDEMRAREFAWPIASGLDRASHAAIAPSPSLAPAQRPDLSLDDVRKLVVSPGS